MEAAEWAIDNGEWKAWCEMALSNGAAAAHKYSRAPRPWQPVLSTDALGEGSDGDGLKPGAFLMRVSMI